MLNNDIFQTLQKAEQYTTYMMGQMVNQKSYGENTSSQKFVVFSHWVDILQRYYNNLQAGNENSFTQDQIYSLMAKIKAAIGNTVLVPFNDWLISLGYWNDNGYWRDSATWSDNVIFT